VGHFLEVLDRFKQKYGEQNVFPDNRHMELSKPCIEAHHGSSVETQETIARRSELMKNYFAQIDDADLVVIINEKNGEEYYGIGTAIELGYSLAKDKKILFVRQPTNSNIVSLILANSVHAFDFASASQKIAPSQ